MYLNSPYFGIILTFLAYLIGSKISSKAKNPLVNSLVITIAIIVGFLLIFDIDYDTYMIGASHIMLMAAPATVALVVPLYKNYGLLKENLIPILIGITVGSIVAIFSVLALSKAMGLDLNMIITMLPQSITTAIGIPLAESLGGIGAITAIIITIRGAIGAVFAPLIFKILKIEDPISIGVSMGCASHAFGTSRAYEIGEVEGSMSGLSIAIAGVISAVLIPLVVLYIL